MLDRKQVANLTPAGRRSAVGGRKFVEVSFDSSALDGCGESMKVFLMGLSTAVRAGTSMKVAQVPASCAPAHDLQFNVADYYNGGHTVVVSVAADGSVSIISPVDLAAGSLLLRFLYPLN